MSDARLAADINQKIDSYLTEIARGNQATVTAAARQREAAYAAGAEFVRQLEPHVRKAFTELSAEGLGSRLATGRTTDVIALRDTSGLPSLVEPLKFGPYTSQHRYLHRFGLLSRDIELTYRTGQAEEWEKQQGVAGEHFIRPPAWVKPDPSGLCHWYDEAGLRQSAINTWSHGSMVESLNEIRSEGRRLRGVHDGAGLLVDTDSGASYIVWDYRAVQDKLVRVHGLGLDDVPRVGIQLSSDIWVEPVGDYVARVVSCELAIEDFRRTRLKR